MSRDNREAMAGLCRLAETVSQGQQTEGIEALAEQVTRVRRTLHQRRFWRPKDADVATLERWIVKNLGIPEGSAAMEAAKGGRI